jgi:NAD(P)-dependent dehydrogenase (short-subunit alcohol dehydrogenase family)
VLFARQRARIFGVDINEAAARETQAIITGEGGTCEVATGDVTDSAHVARLVEACMARFSRIDVLVNNVGKSEPAIPGEMDEALWDSQLAVNLKSAFLCCQAVLPIMQKVTIR